MDLGTGLRLGNTGPNIMKALIIIAHPEPQSMNHSMMKVMVERLRFHGWTVEISDLYADAFTMAPSLRDFRQLRNPLKFSLVDEQLNASLSDSYQQEIQDQQRQVKEADLIIFQFPFWWYSVPAILKGWVERVLGNGFAYDDEHMFENGLLKGKRAMLSLTTGASIDELIADSQYTGTIEQMLKPFIGGVLKFCGIDSVTTFIAPAVSRMNNKDVEKMFNHLRLKIDHVVHSCPSAISIEPSKTFVIERI